MPRKFDRDWTLSGWWQSVCDGAAFVKAVQHAERSRRRGVGGTGSARLGEPTDAVPGSEEKLLVLESRARQGISLTHPNDAHLPSGSWRVPVCSVGEGEGVAIGGDV